MRTTIGLTALAAILAGSASAQELEQVRFGTNWLPQGGHGGFYQALADGTYADCGLEVEIVPGGPQVNNRPMLAAGRLDFLMAGNLLLSFDNTRNDIPTVVVAAFYQKDPQVLIAHSGQYEGFEGLAEAPEILISRDGQFSFWPWLVAEHGFRDESLRPYGFNLAQFLADERVVQQGYGTAEPLYAQDEGAQVDTHLLADHGWNTYSTTIETRKDLVETQPEAVQCFVDGSIIGWYNFLYGDRTPAYDLIVASNPELTADKLDREVQQLMDLGIIDSGDAVEKGIGAIDMTRVADFLRIMEEVGVIEPGSVDPSEAVTDQFVNKGVGLDLRPAE
jgi:NitT/TauT family transport system substrate-binding protein